MINLCLFGRKRGKNEKAERDKMLMVMIKRHSPTKREENEKKKKLLRGKMSRKK